MPLAQRRGDGGREELSFLLLFLLSLHVGIVFLQPDPDGHPDRTLHLVDAVSDRVQPNGLSFEALMSSVGKTC